MNHAQQYRLSGAAEQRRLEELSDRDAESVSDVSGEIGWLQPLDRVRLRSLG